MGPFYLLGAIFHFGITTTFFTHHTALFFDEWSGIRCHLQYLYYCL